MSQSSHQSFNKETRVAIAGLGAIGQSLARSLAQGAVPGIRLVVGGQRWRGSHQRRSALYIWV